MAILGFIYNCLAKQRNAKQISAISAGKRNEHARNSITRGLGPAMYFARYLYSLEKSVCGRKDAFEADISNVSPVNSAVRTC